MDMSSNRRRPLVRTGAERNLRSSSKSSGGRQVGVVDSTAEPVAKRHKPNTVNSRSSSKSSGVRQVEVVDSTAVPVAGRQKPNVEKFFARRAYARDKLERLLRTWDEEKEEADRFQVESYRLQFEELKKELDEYNEKIQDEMTGVALEEEVTQSGVIRDRLGEVIREFFLAKECQTAADGPIDGAGQRVNGDQHEGGARGALGGRKAGPKLSKLEIEKYDGDPIRFQEFWEQFECSVHTHADLSDCERFSYLKALLTDKALRAIEGYSLTSANYHAAIEHLKESFGDPQIIIATIFEAIIKLSITSTKTDSLRSFYDSMQRLIRCLEAQGLKEEEFSKVFVPLILMKLPTGLKIAFSRKRGSTPWNLTLLHQLLKEEVMTQETCRDSVEKRTDKVDQRKTDYYPKKTASMLFSNSRRKGNFQRAPPTFRAKCGYCARGHYSDECQTYPTVESRKRLLGSNRCYNCLGHGHLAADCTRHLCPFCDRRHHRSLCPDRQGKRYPTASSGRGESSNLQRKSGESSHSKKGSDTDGLDEGAGIRVVTMLAPSQRTIMPTAITKVESTNGKQKGISCRVVLDTGSQRSFITQKLADMLRVVPIGSESLSVGSFGSAGTKDMLLPTAIVKLPTLTGAMIELTVNIMSVISTPVRREKLDTRKFEFIKGLSLAEPWKDESSDLEVDMIIGADYYYDVVGTRKIALDRGIYLVKSDFGWLLCGRFDSSSSAGSDSISALLAPSAPTILAPTDEEVEQFWSLDSMGIKDVSHMNDDEIALKKVTDTMTFEKDRYHVRFPWKEPPPNLPKNYDLALGRLNSLERRLEKEPEVRKKYSGIIQQQLEDGIIEQVTPDTPVGQKIHYLPHHGVVRKDAISTKLRIVYDASSKVKRDLNSLNDCLFRGPVLLKDLCGILLRFRLGRIGILSDIEKAFLQIGLQFEDRDVTRFLWYDEQKSLNIYRFCRVPFGVISSPFLLAITVDAHLKNEGCAVANEIRKNIYVDNVCASVNTDDEAKLFMTPQNRFFLKPP